ncbi:MAG: biopolymer transporter ExbD [Methylophilus sp.]|nr:biopolymer transporter ExbD [Methylophilus sp.]
MGILSSSSHLQSNQYQPMSEINTTPLVDVMLVLLVIFIITAPLLQHAVTINLPQASNQPLLEKPEVVSLSLDEAGNIYWNDKLFSKPAFVQQLKLTKINSPSSEIHLRADAQTRYQLIAEVISEIQNSGIHKLSFVTLPNQN